MHVLLIHQAFVLPGEPGGTRHYELGQYVVGAGGRFTVVASGVNYLTGHVGADEDTSRGAGQQAQPPEGLRVVRAYALPALHRSFAWRVAAFVSFMVSSTVAALRVGPVDVVMGTSPPIFQALSAWTVAALRRRPLLLEIRDLWPEFAIDMGLLNNPLLIGLSRRLERFLYAKATHLLVNSPAYLEYLVNKGVPASKISLIPNGVDPTIFHPDADGATVRRVLGLEGKFVVTYAGALGVANDLPTLLRAAARLRDDGEIHFLVVGDGKERTGLERLAREMELANVTFTGPRPKAQMPEILAASDACLAILKNIPMFRMTYPNKVFDYMAAGRPTILAIDGVIRQVLEEAGGGLYVPPGDDLALATAVRELSRNRQWSRSMGSSARLFVTRHFDRRTQGAQFAELLHSLIT